MRTRTSSFILSSSGLGVVVDCTGGAAREKCCRVMTGRELCIYQAADAFRLFTGLEASRERIGEAFDAVIAKRGEPR